MTRASTSALVFAAGNPPPNLAPYLFDVEIDQIVCADGGLAHCLAAGLTPNCLIGDFDSLDMGLLEWPEVASAQRWVHPSNKDASDLELCLDFLTSQENCPDEVVIVGVSGGRSDHHLFNWLLPSLRDWPFGLRLIDDQVDARLVTPQRPCELDCAVGDILSLVPLVEAVGVSTEGLEFVLEASTLSPGSTRGLSNLACASRVRVSLNEGRLLAMRVHDTQGAPSRT